MPQKEESPKEGTENVYHEYQEAIGLLVFSIREREHMSIQFVFGGSGSGKSTYVYQQIIDASEAEPGRQFFVMVPDQFTMSTQKQLCRMSESGGIMNIDVQSFSRLVHRISDEVGAHPKIMLDDTGKNLILRDVALKREGQLVMLGQKLRRTGYIHEVKSMISEFYQYAITPADLEEMIQQAKGKGNLTYKLQDLKVLYEGFQEYISEKYITLEESMLQLCEMIPKSSLLKGCDIVFDGFTGFTPLQRKVLYEIMRVAKKVTITLCADNREDLLYAGNEQELFTLSQETYSKLCRFADREHMEVLDNIFLSAGPVLRYQQHDQKELAFLETELFRYHGNTYQEPVETISVYEAKTTVSEVQKVCQEIKKTVRTKGWCYRDIAVVTGDLSRYTHIVEREFDRYDIPFFMDQNRGVLYHPMTEYLKKALAIVKQNFSFDSIIGFLRSGMSGISMEETDLLARYLKAYGIRGKKAFQKPFFTWEERQEDASALSGDGIKGLTEAEGDSGSLREELSESLEYKAELVRRKLMEEIAPVLEPMKTAADYVTALYSLCVHSCLQEKCMEYALSFEQQGDYSRAKEYEKIYGQCMVLLDQIYQLLGEEKVSRDEFLEIFEAGISEIQIGTIPQNVDQVVVGDIERSRLGEVKALFFIGVNDGVIPGKGSCGGFLSVMEREFFIRQGRQMAPSPRQQIFQQRLYLYQNMTKPTKRLYLSYVRMTGDGKQALPSYLIRVLKGMFPRLQITVEDESFREGFLEQIETVRDGLDDLAMLMRSYIGGEVAQQTQEDKQLMQQLLVCTQAYQNHVESQKLLQAALAGYRPKLLEEKIAGLLYLDKDKGSISRLETYASCGYAQFLKYGLRLRENSDFSFTNIDLGNIYHDVLQGLFTRAQAEGKSLKDITDEQLRDRIDRSIESLETEYGNDILRYTARNRYRVEQMKQVLYTSVRTMKYQLEKGNFQPYCFEQGFSIPGKQKLVGKVDRVDLFTSQGKIYVKVVDYKTSEKSFDETEFYYGLSLQLPFYLYAMVQQLSKRFPAQEVIPAAMLYFGLGNPILKEEDMKSPDNPAQQICKSMRMDGVSLEEDVVLMNLDTSFETESDVIKCRKKKDGYLTAGSQTASREEMELNLKYVKHKADTLMKGIMEGDIAIDPVMVEGSRRNSCTYCAYRQICRFDDQIPGYEVKELPKMTGESRKEAMKHAIDEGSTIGSDNEK